MIDNFESRLLNLKERKLEQEQRYNTKKLEFIERQAIAAEKKAESLEKLTAVLIDISEKIGYANACTYLNFIIIINYIN